MGANMMPTTKNKGRTVFGVKMGLSPRGQHRYSGGYIPVVHILPRLQSLLSKRSICTSISIALCALSGVEAYSEVVCSSSSCSPRGSGPGLISSRWPPSAVFATCWANPRCSAAKVVGAKVAVVKR